MTAAPTLVPLTPELLEYALSKQSADVRAQWTWQAKAMRDWLHQLAVTPLRDTVIDDVTAKVVSATIRFAPILQELGDDLWNESRNGIARILDLAYPELDDEEAEAALRWSWEQIDSALRIASTALPAPFDVTQGRDEDIRAALTTDVGPFWRAQVLILAFLDASSGEATKAVLHELVWRAFDETCKAQDVLAKEGYASSLPSNPDAIRTAARGVRQVMKASDMKQLRAARVVTLR